MELKNKDSKYIANTYARFPLEIVKGEGSLCYDENGKEYIDLSTGIAVNTFGFCDKVWQEAITEQIGTLQHTSNLFYTNPCAELAEMLCERTGMKKVFFSNSGAEANECAIKTARKYAFDKYGDYSHNTVITLKNSFHGRTLATLAATGQDVFHTTFGPFPEGFVYAEANNSESIKEVAANNSCCAIMFEIVQGEGGVCPLTKEFVETIIETAEKYNLLLICDEVQTGNGRTGELYSYMNYGFTPDIVSTAKGLAGGLPLGATLLGEKVEDTLTPSSHGSTFGGNPVCCAAAKSIVSRIDDELLKEVKAKSEYIINELSDAEGVKSVSGLGFMLGIETEKEAKEIIAACREKGLLVISAKTKVRLLPALNIGWDTLKKAVEILKECIK
ncbi:MAG: acetylornithine/succinylornithine family transaminase [Ruminococcaceae bacterium]|nr:acetylornithine/succinylornithine family transaminase [Oscillospiraceae bacterium]